MKKLIQFLKNHDVHDIHVCSGSRNYEILLSLKNEFNVFYHTNERNAAFELVGKSRLINSPVVLITSSGTAVSQTLSAVIEAFYEHLPLIILSADRPEFMHELYSAQVVNQKNILRKYVRTFISDLSELNCKKVLFPCHINLCVSQGEVKQVVHAQKIDFERIDEKMNSENTLIISSYRNQKWNEDYYGLEYRYALWEKSSCIKINSKLNDIQALELLKSPTIKYVLKLGHTPVSKIWRELEKKSYAKVYSFHPFNQFSLSTEYLIDWNLSHIDLLLRKLQGQPLDLRYFEKNDLVESEQLMMQNAVLKLPTGSHVFLGNSSPIRDFNHCNVDHLSGVWSSRGANGIDGIISQALGIAKSCHENVYLFIGDVSFMYDLSVVVEEFPKNFFLIIIDNRGGQIFSRIKRNEMVMGELRTEKLDEVLKTLGANFVRKIEDFDFTIQFNVLLPNQSQTDLYLSRLKQSIQEIL